MKPLLVMLVSALLAGCASSTTRQSAPAKPAPPPAAATDRPPIRLGNFSVSLSVKDLGVSRAFYEKLGFTPVGGDRKSYIIMQSENCTIGLFQGMFQGNILTFNPGWDRACNTLPTFDDIRAIQKSLRALGVTLTTAADESSDGPASITLADPDGNMILLDQHVAAPKKERQDAPTR